MLVGVLAHGSEPEDATVTVERLHATVAAVMSRADELGYTGRYEELEPVVRNSFNIPTITRIAAGAHWTRLDSGERDALIDLFGDFVVSTYAHRFNDYSGQNFETLGHESIRPGLEMVHARIHRPAEEDVVLNYVLKAGDDGWRIVDIHLRGTVSQVSVWRSEFGSILSRQGFDELLVQLQKKIAGHQGA